MQHNTHAVVALGKRNLQVVNAVSGALRKAPKIRDNIQILERRRASNLDSGPFHCTDGGMRRSPSRKHPVTNLCQPHAQTTAAAR